MRNYPRQSGTANRIRCRLQQLFVQKNNNWCRYTVLLVQPSPTRCPPPALDHNLYQPRLKVESVRLAKAALVTSTARVHALPSHSAHRYAHTHTENEAAAQRSVPCLRSCSLSSNLTSSILCWALEIPCLQYYLLWADGRE